MKSFHHFTLFLEGKAGALVEAQVFQAHVSMTLSDIFSEIYDLNLEGRLRTDMLIVRLPVEEEWKCGRDLTLASEWARQRLLGAADRDPALIFERARDRAVHILTSCAGEHVLTPNLNPYWQHDPLDMLGITSKEATLAIRRAEFDYILERSRAILTCPSGSLYKAPSGRLIRSFVRVGNVQCSRDKIDAISFWLLPYLRGVRAVLTDTWSISSIAFNVARLCSTYFGSEPCRVEMLPSYHDGSEEANCESRAVVERLNADCTGNEAQPGKMLILISATQTGSLARHLHEIFATSQIELEPLFVAVFALGTTHVNALHDLSGDPRFSLREEHLDRPSEPVTIDPQVYFPLHFEDTPIELNKALADRSRAFFDRYVGHRLVEVHRIHKEASGRPRHHAIHLATSRLPDIPEFVDRFNKALASISNAPMMIVSPPHEAGRGLAAQAKLFFESKGAACPTFEHQNLYIPSVPQTEEERVIREMLKGAKDNQSLLIIDDVCITGTRLSQYQRWIRTEGFQGRIDYLVGIARPSQPDLWKKLLRNLTYRGAGRPPHTVTPVDFVLLPDWRENECPWCSEQRLYDSWLKAGRIPELLLKRHEFLAGSSEEGISDNLFLNIPELPPMSLGPDSLYASERSNQAEVFAAVAAALQHLRSESSADRPPLGPRHFPVSTVLKHTDYLRATWTDSILRASFLRAAIIDELTYADPTTENHRSEVLRELLTQETDGEHDIALEILLAANLEKCSVKPDAELIDCVQKFGVPDVFSYMLERIADLQRRR